MEAALNPNTWREGEAQYGAMHARVKHVGLALKAWAPTKTRWVQGLLHAPQCLKGEVPPSGPCPHLCTRTLHARM